MPGHPKRPPLADMRTSELLRVAASYLGPTLEERGVAAELRVRALWLERASTDDGLPADARRAVAAIENVATAQPEAVPVVGVEVYGGWWFALWRRDTAEGALYDVALARPSARRDRPAWQAALRPSVEDAIEGAAGFLSRELGIPSARIAEALASTIDDPPSSRQA